MKTEVVQGDIVNVKADVIVNSASFSGFVGSGVDGCIHEAAGKKLNIEFKKKLQKCLPFKNLAKAFDTLIITDGYDLPCKMVFHVCAASINTENYKKVLEEQYFNIFSRAMFAEAKSVAVPLLGAGMNKIPVSESYQAFDNAINRMRKIGKEKHGLDSIKLVTYKASEFDICNSLYFGDSKTMPLNVWINHLNPLIINATDIKRIRICNAATEAFINQIHIPSDGCIIIDLKE